MKPLKYTASIKISAFALIIFGTFLFSGCSGSETESKPLAEATTFAGFAERFGEPFGIAARNGAVYVSDGETGKIWRVENNAASVFAEGFDTPSHIAFDRNGDLIVADSGTHTIRRVKPNGAIETVAGMTNRSGYADGEASAALFNAPIGVAVFENKIFVADTYNDRIRIVENGRVSTLAGGAQGFVDGAGNAAKFDTPAGIAATGEGNLIVADTNNRRLRFVAANGETRTLAGNGNSNLKDGFLSDSEFVQPVGVAISDSGAVFVADGNAIRVVRGFGLPFVETISGDRRGFADGVLRQSRFNRPSGMTIDESGDLYVADSENKVVRVFSGSETGAIASEADKAKLRISAEEFRKAAPARWTYDPPNAPRDVAGTLGELRGEVDAPNKQVWFHNGFDIAGAYGETARFVRDGKVLRPVAAENFETLRELVRLPTLGYIHIRLGRDKDGRVFDDQRFQFSTNERGKLNGVRIPRGAKFRAGEPVGTLNAFNHVHLIAGASGAEMNALAALEFPGIADSVAPTIEKVSLFDENWRPFETSGAERRISLNGKTRIVVRAFDRMNGNSARRKLGVYRLGYRILREDGSETGEIDWTISFAEMPDERAARTVYAAGSQSGYTPETIFNYTVTNRVAGDTVGEDFLDAANLENGNYTIRVFAADFFNNVASKDIEIEVTK
jgi:sugar lactone lactonase YvrE